MEYLNFDVEISPKQGSIYLVAARSEAGEARHVMRFPLEGLALDNVLLRVQNALLRAGDARRGTPEEQMVESFGRLLFETLLGADVGRLYDASTARATQQDKGVRMRLNIQDSTLATLPWEFLYDPLKKEYLCFLSNIVLVRYLAIALPAPPLQVALPLRVLAMQADPSDQTRLQGAQEKQRLLNALGPLQQRGLVKLQWVEGQTVQDLHQALMQRDWHVFHFIGHGAEGVLALVNAQGTTHPLDATDLGRLLAQRPSLRLVVLNACQGAVGSKHTLFSSTAATLASKGLPAVLAMQYDISDRAAVEFTRGFYGALAVGLPVDGAVTQARTAISVSVPRTLEWVTPVLYLRAPSGALFTVSPSSSRPLPHQNQTKADKGPPVIAHQGADGSPSGAPLLRWTDPGYVAAASPQHRQRRNTWLVAVALTLLVMVALGLGLGSIIQFSPGPGSTATSSPTSAVKGTTLPTLTPPPTQPFFLKYTSDDQSFSVTYPSSWVPTRYTSVISGEGIKFTPGQQASGSSKQAFSATRKSRAPDGLTSAESVGQQICQPVNPTSRPDVQTISLGGITGWTQTRCDSDPGATEPFRQVVNAVVYKGALYVLVYASPKATFEEDYQQYFQPMEASFTFGA